MPGLTSPLQPQIVVLRGGEERPYTTEVCNSAPCRDFHLAICQFDKVADSEDHPTASEMDDRAFLVPMDIDHSPGVPILPMIEPSSTQPSPACSSPSPSSAPPSRAATRKRIATRAPGSARKAKAPTIAGHAWESVRDEVYRLYVQENTPLLEMAKTMLEIHGFNPTYGHPQVKLLVALAYPLPELGSTKPG